VEHHDASCPPARSWITATSPAADLLYGAGRSEDAMAELKRAIALFVEIGGSGPPRAEIWRLERS
jgi:hypothetical protein